MSWTDPPFLTGRHVTLRPMQATDRDGLLAAAADGQLWRLFYTTVPGPETVDGWISAAARDARAMPFVVLRDGRIVGATRFMRMNPGDRRLEIGTTFYAASVQRSPVNSEAKLLLMTHAFQAMDCICVQFRTDWLNRRSRAAIERLGAKQDGVLRAHKIVPGGRVRDTVVYSVTAAEWPGVKAGLELSLSR